MPPLRFMLMSRFARLLSSREKPSSQSMQCRHMATTHSERDNPSREMNRAGMAGSRTVGSEELVQHEDRNRGFQRASNPNLRGSTGFHGRSGPSGLGYGDNSRWDHMAGEAKGRASLESPDVGDDTETDDDHATSSMDNDAFERHLRHRANAGALKGDSMAWLHDRGEFSKPDGANFDKGRPQGDIPRVFTSLQKGETPRRHGTAPRAEEYNVCKARVHASLWQKEIEKQVGEAASVEGNTGSVSIDASGSPPYPRDGKEGSLWDTNKTVLEDWETFVRPEEEFNEETAVKEEAMMLEEFERRKEHNRIKIASFVKQHLYARRRPVDGWKYIVNNFGSESKGEKGSALKLDLRQVRANNLEKLTLKREGVQSRQRT